MSVATAVGKKWTVAEYLAMEEKSLDKHEYFDGEIFALAGASETHDSIVGDLVVALKLALRGKCRIYTADMRLFVPATGLYTYADASVVCGRPDLTDDNPPALRNPDMIFEVLSDSTESYDRGDKFANYRTIPSLSHYVLIAQHQVLVEHFARQPDGKWLLEELHAGQLLRFPCGSVAVNDLYLQASPLPRRARQISG
jgi:Uma2 family endonuclease